MNTTDAIRRPGRTSAISLSRQQRSTAIPWQLSPERLRQAAAEIAGHHPDASPDDVLLWAEARALPAA